MKSSTVAKSIACPSSGAASLIAEADDPSKSCFSAEMQNQTEGNEGNEIPICCGLNPRRIFVFFVAFC
jgi:hypothetical protein